MNVITKVQCFLFAVAFVHYALSDSPTPTPTNATAASTTKKNKKTTTKKKKKSKKKKKKKPPRVDCAWYCSEELAAHRARMKIAETAPHKLDLLEIEAFLSFVKDTMGIATAGLMDAQLKNVREGNRVCLKVTYDNGKYHQIRIMCEFKDSLEKAQKEALDMYVRVRDAQSRRRPPPPPRHECFTDCAMR